MSDRWDAVSYNFLERLIHIYNSFSSFTHSQGNRVRSRNAPHPSRLVDAVTPSPGGRRLWCGAIRPGAERLQACAARDIEDAVPYKPNQIPAKRV